MTEAPKSFEEHFHQNIDTEIEVLEKYILNSSCKTFEEYRWCTGQLVGLKVAKAKFDEMATQLREHG